MKSSPPALSALAASATHALNNVTSVLFAAASHLESAGDDRPLVRARAALDDACGAARALSAALSLLALTEDDVGAALRAGCRPDVMVADDWARIAELLQSTAAVAWIDEAPGNPAALSLSRDVVESVLACAAVSLKRASPAGASLTCRVTRAPASAGHDGEIAFSLEADAAASTDTGGSRPSPHPCNQALAHAASLLVPLGVAIGVSPAGGTRVAVRLAPQG